MSMITVVTDHHKSDGHIHETNGHKSSSEHGEKRKEEGKTEMKGISALEYVPISINIMFTCYFY